MWFTTSFNIAVFIYFLKSILEQKKEFGQSIKELNHLKARYEALIDHLQKEWPSINISYEILIDRSIQHGDSPAQPVGQCFHQSVGEENEKVFEDL